LQGCDSFFFRCQALHQTVHHVHQSWWNALSAGEVAGGASPDKDFVSLLGCVWCVCMWAHNVRHCWSLEKSTEAIEDDAVTNPSRTSKPSIRRYPSPLPNPTNMFWSCDTL
jgi:hypothetical protein